MIVIVHYLGEKEDDYDYTEENKKSGWKYWDMEPVADNPKPDMTPKFKEKPRIYPKLDNDNDLATVCYFVEDYKVK